MHKRKITDTDKLIARNIRRLRELYGLDRRILEEKAGISYGILDQIEAFHKPAGKTIQERLSKALNCPLSEFYSGETTKKVREPITPYLTKRQRRLLNMEENLTNEELEEVLDYIAWLRVRRSKGKG